MSPMLAWGATAVLIVLAVPVMVACGYLGLLAILARHRPLPQADRSTPFTIVVPAHNESAGITPTVESLLAIDYPRSAFSVLVIADNCTDDTAAQARAAGATVLERQSATERGKGFALALAYAHVMAEGKSTAVVVVDADTLVSRNLLTACSARLITGAEALQVEYLVRNPDDSWRTRLLHIAFTLFHTVRSLGREQLRVSCGLRGNGMCFTTALLRRVPADAYSVVEDVEYGITLGRAGVRVHYVEDATVYGEMPGNAAASTSQRQRWEGGRRALVQAHGWPMLFQGLRQGDGVLVDLAMDLLVPPLSRLGMLSVAGVMVSLIAWALGAGPGGAVAWSLSFLALLLYIARGIQYAGLGARGLVDLAYAPFYALWSLSTRRRQPASAATEWVRTTRNLTPEEPPGE